MRHLRLTHPTKMALQKEVGEHYEMSRCLLIESGLPDKLWNHAVQTSAYVRNRCYNRCTKKTAYELFTGNVPNISKLQKF